MNQRPTPFAGILAIAGAGLSLGAAAWDSLNTLVEYPTVIVTLLAAGLIVSAVIGLAAGARGAYGVSVVLALLLAGYWLNTVTLTLYFTHEFADAIVLATLGGAVAIIGAALTLSELVRTRPAPSALPHSPVQTPVTGQHAAVAGAAPAGWYPDPGGGGGQRYWDGAAWGQTYPS